MRAICMRIPTSGGYPGAKRRTLTDVKLGPARGLGSVGFLGLSRWGSSLEKANLLKNNSVVLFDGLPFREVKCEM